MLSSKSLSPRQRFFAMEYLIDLNATRAAIRAGYSIATANVQGPRLLKNPAVRAAIQENMKKRAQRINIAADDVLAEVTRIALHRISVGLGTRFHPSIRMASKRKALDQLARHLGPYAEPVQAACADEFMQRVSKSDQVQPENEDDGIPQENSAAPLPASHCDWMRSYPTTESDQNSEVIDGAERSTLWPIFVGSAASDYDPTES